MHGVRATLTLAVLAMASLPGCDLGCPDHGLCTPVPASMPPVLGGRALIGSWDLTYVNAEPVRRGVRLTFNADGSAEGIIACNFLHARYRVSSRRVILEGGRMTERGCVDWPPWIESLDRTLISPSTVAQLTPDGQHIDFRGVLSLRFTRLN